MSTDHNFSTERRAEADSNRGPSAHRPNILPLGQTGSQPQVKPTLADFIVVEPVRTNVWQTLSVLNQSDVTFECQFPVEPLPAVLARRRLTAV